ncbi:uncharacterized protein LOC131929383 isoform X2 [Physella acuta]|uniref:uncharacterized protein LOC131929383 isoform X2 n=1 Tax=Physella acuta TaxID=109671 RepID=UPI0027DCE05B|nr:uncharacterized protein LOC131929383 isoform X2 [Physella acuta]
MAMEPPIPGYFINFTSGTIVSSIPANSSRPPLLTILTQTTSHVQVQGSNNEQDEGSESNDEDLFGEHYFHICIYIWACVVVSSLIALSVLHLSLQKWGCCGRSLTRWEVKRIPLKRFQKTEGDDCQDKCPICHEEFNEGRLIRQLPCNHCYHSYCVDRWLVKMSNRCPLCKQRVSISLFCPWNKQQRKKDIHGHIACAEASVDESPPLPPLSTLTPSNWYGEDIMSGPSRFIIMRPGRPTRVIDIREQNKKAKAEHEAKVIAAREGGADAKSGSVERSTQLDTAHLSENVLDCDADRTHSVSLSDDETVGLCIRSSSTSSSRSSSISSDQPLLVETRVGANGEKEVHIVCDPEHSALSLHRCQMAGGGDSGNTQHSADVGLPNVTTDQHPTSEATITISSGSSSVVTCNFKPARASQYHSPSSVLLPASIHSAPKGHVKHLSWPGVPCKVPAHGHMDACSTSGQICSSLVNTEDIDS